MTQHFRVAVLGAGMSGICMGVQLKKAGVNDFVILEKADSVGGTWRENTYPGVACDVPSHLYSFSFDLNPNWSHSYSSGGEIWGYCEEVSQKHDLKPHFRFGSAVENVKFADGCWTVDVAGGPTLTADIVVSGLGGLHLPNHADIEGLNAFEGAKFHTAQWDHGHNLKGRRVGIIGTGASAVQVLPAIADDVKQVTVFQRSAAWVFPRVASDIPDSRRSLFNRFPPLMRLYRWFLFALMDVLGVLSLRRNSFLSDRLKKVGLDHLEESVSDPELREKLTPDYTPGCKRRCIADDYWSTFNRDNVHLVTEAIDHVEPGGIRDASGTLHELDTIIEATGFCPFDITDYVNIEGRDGRTLRDVWKDKVETFRTIMVPGFPNFFLLLGPNSATGHTSALIMIESQVQYILKCLKLMERENMSHLDPAPDVVTKYNARLQRDMKRMVFSGGCNAWYTDAHDRNYTLWPYSACRFLAELLSVKKAEFLQNR